jgi:hypothetical protein
MTLSIDTVEVVISGGLRGPAGEAPDISDFETIGKFSGVNTYIENHTLSLTDFGCAVEIDVAEDNTVTVPPDSEVAFEDGTFISILQVGAGSTSIVAGEGVTIQSTGSLTIGDQWGGGSLYKQSSNVWVWFGAGGGGGGATGDYEPLGRIDGVNVYTSSNHTLTLDDVGQSVEMDVADANTITVPTNADVEFPLYTFLNVLQVGAGSTTIVPDDGVTIETASPSLDIGTQWAGGSLYKRATNTWVWFGLNGGGGGDDQNAGEVYFAPAGNIGADTVQTAIQELDSEKLAASSYTAADVLTKLLTVDGSGSGLDADTLRGTTPTAFGLSLLDDAAASNARTTLGLVIGTDVATPTEAKTEVLMVALGDETTDITTGNAKVTMRMPFAMTLTAVRASLATASSSGTPTVDINEGGSTILSTKLTIDANEKTSTTAATPAVISDSALADDAEITFDIDVAGTGAKGLKVTLIGTRA